VIDYKRFSADECADYVSFQRKILKANVRKEQFVTTNFMHHHTEVNPWLNDDLDFISYTMYPISGRYAGIGDQGFRLGEPSRISYANDFFRPLKGITGVMELQPGQINWAPLNPQLYPGVVRAWLWNCFAGGLSFACTYRYRQPLFGCEQYHYGIVGTDGVTLSSGGAEYKQFMQEMKQIRTQYSASAVCPADYAARKTAFLFNLDNLWDTEWQKQTIQWDYKKHQGKLYSAVKSLCVPVDFISEKVDFSAYNVMVAPAYQLLDKQLVDRWKSYAENGGNLVLTCRTGQKDSDGHLWETLLQQPIWDLIGAKIEYVDQLPDNIEAKVKFEDTAYDWYVWGEVITPANDTQSLATYSDQFYSGKSASVSRKFAKGSVTYIGVQTLNGELEKQILRKIYTQQNARILDLPDYVFTEWRDGFWVTVNYSSLPVEAPIPTGATILIGEKNVKPAGVVVWMENN